MAKYRVYMNTTASASVDVEVDDNLSPDEARDAAIDAAHEAVPREVCAQCSGWGRDYGLDLGEWEVDDGTDAVTKRDD